MRTEGASIPSRPLPSEAVALLYCCTVERAKDSVTSYCTTVLHCFLRTDLLGDLDRVKQIVKLNGFVQCVDGFTGQPQVVNGASDLLVEVRQALPSRGTVLKRVAPFRSGCPGTVQCQFLCKTFPFILGSCLWCTVLCCTVARYNWSCT